MAKKVSDAEAALIDSTLIAGLTSTDEAQQHKTHQFLVKFIDEKTKELGLKPVQFVEVVRGIPIFSHDLLPGTAFREQLIKRIRMIQPPADLPAKP